MAEHTEGLRVIRCKGSWLEIGRQYGEELRADIAHASRAIEELTMAAGYDRMSLKARINDYIPYAHQLPARWDELAGVAQGSRLAIEDVLLMQMLEDLLIAHGESVSWQQHHSETDTESFAELKVRLDAQDEDLKTLRKNLHVVISKTAATNLALQHALGVTVEDPPDPGSGNG